MTKIMKDVLEAAGRAMKRLELNDTEELREQIVDAALAFGYSTIWTGAFRQDADMVKRLKFAFRVV